MSKETCESYPNTFVPVLSKADRRLARDLELFRFKPDDAFVDLKVVCALRCRSPSSTLRDVKAGRLAPPIKIAPNASRYRVGDVRDSLKGGE
jgi:hypothetical protein